MRLLFAMAALVLASACSIQQRVVPVTFASTASREVCIIENRATRGTFLTEYENALRERGFSTRTVPEHSPLSTCPVMTTYEARWSWDVTIYMSYVQLEVYHNGENVGRAEYDARSGAANLGKWVDAETKIRELVGQLFVQQN